MNDIIIKSLQIISGIYELGLPIEKENKTTCPFLLKLYSTCPFKILKLYWEENSGGKMPWQ